MSWCQITLLIEPALIEQVEDLLLDLGALAITLRDAGDQPILEPLPDETPLWDEVKLTALFPDTADTEQIRSALYQSRIVTHDDTIELSFVADEDWSRKWLDRFTPMRFGDRLWIVPRHLTPPEPEAINLRLDPGLAFGTGTHPTTALCLRQLDSLPSLEGKRVLDFGCGSGVLAIAALLLGADSAHCVDIDPQAHQATRANAEVNGVNERIVMTTADELRADSFDLVMANILAGPLTELAVDLCQWLKPGGHLMLSGILSDQAEAVQSAYAPWCTGFETATVEDWIRITAQCIRSV